MCNDLMRDFVRYNEFKYDDISLFSVEIDEEKRSGTLYIKNRCSWMKNGYGCTMCNYSCRDNIVANDIIENHLDCISKEMSNHELEHIKIYMNGSFFCDQEVSSDNRYRLLMELHKHCGTRSFTVESRVEYLNKNNLSALICRLPEIEIKVSIGLESTNDEILKYSINKGITFRDFKKVYFEIKDLVDIKVYLLLKPILLTEEEALDDVVSSINDLTAIGIKHISVTPLSVQNQTITKFLLEEHKYRPLWLWSIIELNSRISNLKLNDVEINVAGFYHKPLPEVAPFNCEKCSKYYIDRINKEKGLTWNDIHEKCDCYNDWCIEMKKNNLKTIGDRYKEALSLQQKSILRSKNIIESVGVDYNNLQLTDVAKKTPSISSKIDFVGVEKVPIRFNVNHKNKTINFLGYASLSVELDEFHNGIHMSRLIEDIKKFCDYEHKDIMFDVKKAIKESAGNQCSEACKIQLNIDYYSELNSFVSHKKSIVKIPIELTGILKKGEFCNIVKVEFDICNACPCTKMTNFELFENINSHTQRGKVFLNIEDWSGDLFDILEWCIQHYMLRSLLKREDEIHLVNKIYDTPLFCEDICRIVSDELLKTFNSRFKSIIVKVVTEESIHPHNAFAIKRIKTDYEKI